jgi:hypothetical protein
VELHPIDLFFPAERVFSGGAIISTVTKGIYRVDTTYGYGAEFSIWPNADVAAARSLGCTLELLCQYYMDVKIKIKGGGL